MSLTRQDITNRCRLLLGEELGTESSETSFIYNTLIDTAVDEMCGKSDAYWASVETDVVANVSLYCCPQIYKVEGVTYRGADGTIHVLQETSSMNLDGTNRTWRNDLAAPPRYFVSQGLNQIVLYPVPDTSSSVFSYIDLVIGTVTSTQSTVTSVARPFVTSDVGSSLIVSGGTNFNINAFRIVAVSGVTATVDGILGTAAATGGIASLSQGGLTIEGFGTPTGTWAVQSALCPLPDRFHMCLIWRVCIMRAGMHPSKENIAKMPWISEEYKTAMGLLEAQAAQFTRGIRHGDVGEYRRRY